MATRQTKEDAVSRFIAWTSAPHRSCVSSSITIASALTLFRFGDQQPIHNQPNKSVLRTEREFIQTAAVVVPSKTHRPLTELIVLFGLGILHFLAYQSNPSEERNRRDGETRGQHGPLVPGHDVHGVSIVLVGWLRSSANV